MKTSEITELKYFDERMLISWICELSISWVLKSSEEKSHHEEKKTSHISLNYKINKLDLKKIHLNSLGLYVSNDNHFSYIK